MSDNIRYDQPQGGKPSAIKISRSLAGLSFPATRSEAVEYARHSGASRRVIQTLQQAEERRYNDIDDLLGATGL